MRAHARIIFLGILLLKDLFVDIESGLTGVCICYICAPSNLSGILGGNNIDILSNFEGSLAKCLLLHMGRLTINLIRVFIAYLVLFVLNFYRRFYLGLSHFLRILLFTR